MLFRDEETMKLSYEIKILELEQQIALLKLRLKKVYLEYDKFKEIYKDN